MINFCCVLRLTRSETCLKMKVALSSVGSALCGALKRSGLGPEFFDYLTENLKFRFF